MHYYQFNPKNYMSKTSFLEPMEDLAYRRMLDHCYLTELPLPCDIDEIAMLIRMRSHCDSIKIVLRYFFELTDDGYINDTVNKVIEEYHAKSTKAKASADARWEKERIKRANASNEDANALRNECESNANNKQLTINNEQVTSNKDIPSDKPKRFNFKSELQKTGCDEKLADGFMAVRKTKKATNSEQAFNSFLKKVNESGMTVNQVLEVCIDRDWKTFDISWLQNQGKKNSTDNFHDSFYGVGQSPFGKQENNQMRDVGDTPLLNYEDTRF